MNSPASATPSELAKRGLNKVPPFPPLAARLLSMLADPEVELRKVAELIGADPTFTARLLQCVNSIEFGLVYPVGNVQQAVSLLGIDRTRNVVVLHATAVYSRGALRTAELRRSWRHTVATAVIADEIAKSCRVFVQAAFTAGIMHDIGRLGLLVAFPREYERIIRFAAERCIDLLDFEREEFGLDHAEAGRLLAERWGLPSQFRIIAGRHHDPCEGAELTLLRIVHVACRLADAFGYDMTKPLVPLSIDEILAELPERVRERMQSSGPRLCEQIEQRILEYDSTDVPSAPPSVRNEPEPAPAPILSTPPPRPRVQWIIALVVVALAAALFIWISQM
ncbi:MAG: HDOD domain-containing protein [Bryobacteraceae bacterium]